MVVWEHNFVTSHNFVTWVYRRRWASFWQPFEESRPARTVMLLPLLSSHGPTMASAFCLLPSASLGSRNTALWFICLQLLLIPFFRTNLSQDLSSSSGRAIASCQSQLLSLIPRAPSVRGTVHSPAVSWCNDLNRIYRQQPSCIRLLLLGSSDFNYLPIDRTLATQLRHLQRCLFAQVAYFSTLLLSLLRMETVFMLLMSLQLWVCGLRSLHFHWRRSCSLDCDCWESSQLSSFAGFIQGKERPICCRWAGQTQTDSFLYFYTKHQLKRDPCRCQISKLKTSITNGYCTQTIIHCEIG